MLALTAAAMSRVFTSLVNFSLVEKAVAVAQEKPKEGASLSDCSPSVSFLSILSVLSISLLHYIPLPPSPTCDVVGSSLRLGSPDKTRILFPLFYQRLHKSNKIEYDGKLAFTPTNVQRVKCNTAVSTCPTCPVQTSACLFDKYNQDRVHSHW